MAEDVRTRIEGFILDAFLLGDTSGLPGPSDSLIETGVIDSTGVLELIEFVEGEFGIRVEDDETVPDNLDSVDSLVAFVQRKLG
ncbi:acyl carrier protein [Microbacterium sp. 18062]|uniref:acyl carrier protein n=1 Tax=Microbacterium sp. 18062 TaxID=2681410 RepID=UPI0013582B38|nr:acyl carrier protein [Microbacterium sp. 18062]